MVNIPLQLRNFDFRFFLVQPDGKKPIERSWNKDNCYHFFDEKLVNHRFNYGVACGYGNLIVIDFDDRDYYNSVKPKLPETFTVITANKRLPHLYYLLEGEMIKKQNVLDKEGKVLCDIQAKGSGVVGAGSRIEERQYKIVTDMPLSVITLEQLKDIFGIRPRKFYEYQGDKTEHPEEIANVIKVLQQNHIQRTTDILFKCPFHTMEGKGNLSVFGNGHLYCFHCQRFWKDVQSFINEVNRGKV